MPILLALYHRLQARRDRLTPIVPPPSGETRQADADRTTAFRRSKDRLTPIVPAAYHRLQAVHDRLKPIVPVPPPSGGRGQAKADRTTAFRRSQTG